MSDCSEPSGRPVRVVLCLRAPLGGLFRHVCDLARGLAGRGIEVAVVCDEGDYGELARDRLAGLGSVCALGIHKVAMPRHAGLGDLTALAELRRLCAELRIDIIHGHGAKGGAHARLVARLGRVRALYTPHGGALHYTTSTPAGLFYITLERVLRRLGGPVLFESAYSAGVYGERIGPAPDGSAVIHNGLEEDEFSPVKASGAITDVMFLGELRALKGPFVLADALDRLADQGRKVQALFVGRGPDEAALAARLGRLSAISARMEAPMPAREAFARARLLVVPSLAESLPYVVLEAAAASVPMVATRVGGIPEIFGPMADRLVEPGNPARLADAIAAALDDPAGARAGAEKLRGHVRAHFPAERMVEAIAARYMAALAPAGAAAGTPLPHPSV